MNRIYTEQHLPNSKQKDSHSEYFSCLENKLLEESDKLTNFMGKSTIQEKNHPSLKNHSSNCTPHPTQIKPHHRPPRTSEATSTKMKPNKSTM